MPSAYLQWRFHSGERVVARGPLVLLFLHENICVVHYVPTPKGIGMYYFWCRFFWHWCLRHTFLSAQYLVNQLLDSYQILPASVAQLDARPTGDQEVAGSTPAEVGNILSWRLIMKYFLRSFSPFRWFKKGSCQFLAKECAQYWLTAWRTKPAQ